MEWIHVLWTLVKGLSDVLGFLFFRPWGWGILSLLIILVIGKQGISGDGSWRLRVFVLNLSEKIASLLLFMPQIITALLVLFVIAFMRQDIEMMTEAILLEHQKTLLTQTLKNLQFEGKLLDIRAETAGRGYQLTLMYYTHSPWQNTPLLRQTQTLVVEEKRIYVDFGVCNFDYSLIGQGTAYNLAFPFRLYTETIPPEKGYSLFAGEEGLLWSFDIPDDDLVGIDRKDFHRMGSRIVQAITNTSLARQLGIRTFYGQAIAIDIAPGRTYQFITTGTGGVKLLP